MSNSAVDMLLGTLRRCENEDLGPIGLAEAILEGREADPVLSPAGLSELYRDPELDFDAAFAAMEDGGMYLDAAKSRGLEGVEARTCAVLLCAALRMDELSLRLRIAQDRT